MGGQITQTGHLCDDIELLNRDRCPDVSLEDMERFSETFMPATLLKK